MDEGIVKFADPQESLGKTDRRAPRHSGRGEVIE
jgi:hypothetical protein